MSCFNKINFLESCKEMFMCSICCDPKNNEYCIPFSTSVVSEFLEHQENEHKSVTEIECVYCCCLISITNIIQHVKNHFLDLNSNKTKCPLCQESFPQNIRSIQSHMQLKHSVETLRCPYCYRTFSSLDELQSHLVSSQMILFHCPFPECFVKSQSKVAILYHLNNKHNGSRCIRVHSQFLCAESATPNQHCNCLTSPDPVPNGLVKLSPIMNDDPQLISLPYSQRVLAKLSTGLDIRLQDDIKSKMEQYSKFKVQLEVVEGQKQFVCATCQYRSVHSLADVRKHILGCHCSVSTSYTRLCLRASRLDTNNLTLYSDRKLISFANEKLKKTENGSSWESNCDLSGLQLLDDSEQESESTVSECHVRSSKRQSMSGGVEISAKKAKLLPRQLHSNKMRSDSPVPEVGPPLERYENFDKVIQLNYSWPVLEKLISGQCPDRYLPILKQKMEVYSQHRILLTRRNGKRYFLCSHCPNCSPHGMNDIRKHILGVHARLPERFKSAAMYCSRMNRDNYALLSDEELLKKNQDMVRWRAHPTSGQEDFTEVIDHLPLLNRCLSPDECNNIDVTSDYKSHNVFLSEDQGSPGPLIIATEPINSYYQNVSQMPLAALFTSLLRTTSNTKHNHQSGESSSPTSNVTANVNGKGRSRRSLVLKSKSTNHNCQNPVNNIS